MSSLANPQPSVCYPTASISACSWDPKVMSIIGRGIAKDAIREDVGVLLGPGLNIKRSPLCGRNFEYFSEDPYLSGVLAAAFVESLQSVGVGCCPKHFAVNNQETRRQTVSAEVEERALREVYLPGFERVVRAGPWMLMSSYNRLNGRKVNEDEHLMDGVLRKEWGFKGVVVSDWGAIRDRAAAVRVGGDLEMPGSSGVG